MRDRSLRLRTKGRSDGVASTESHAQCNPRRTWSMHQTLLRRREESRNTSRHNVDDVNRIHNIILISRYCVSKPFRTRRGRPEYGFERFAGYIWVVAKTTSKQ